MAIDATAAALVAEEPVAEEVTSETPQTEDEQLAEIFDAGEVTEEEPETNEAPDSPEDEAPETEQVEEASAEVEVPSELPNGIKRNWSSIPEEARTAFLDSQREAARKLSDQGRMIQGIAPIRDVLVEAAQKLPTLKDSTPADIAREVFALAEMSNKFNTDPINTMVSLVKQHGLEQAVSQALSGQDVSKEAQGSVELHNEIKALKKQITDLTDPEYLRNQVSQIQTESEASRSVNEFASKAEHWDAVEPHMPMLIQVAQAKLGEGASSKDVLESAYELAVSQFVPKEVKAKSEPATDEVAPVSDPEKAKAAIKAKSVNVRSRGTGKGRELTEDQELEAVWARNQA